ncbi:DNA polymerase III subunit beta [Micromonospora sp. C41]|uniref:DNA polymerase III subunit beta n=1 Tax=Micromonospora sp. C41 TaxID=2824878 RepID=UPI001B36C2F6|nr:DNA polymerase III subunit beta [Micromonospora sp. C41]MBQ1064506.1 DNA polymerase III subunit beta [Micromonospora sp. C41]
MNAFTFTTDAKTFTAAVAWTAKHLPTRPHIPVIAGLLISQHDGITTLAAFDYDTSATTTLNTDGSGNGQALVSGRLLAELAKTFPDKPVTVTVDTTARITCGSLKLTLPLMTVEDYPTLPATPPTVGEIDADRFADLITRVGLAADTTGASSIQALRGIHLAFTADTVEALGTDRYRAARGHTDWTGKVDSEVTALVPAAVLIDTAKTLHGAGQATVGCDNHLFSITAGGRTVTSRLMADPFPVQMRTAFGGRGEQPVTMWAADLSAALKRADLVRADKKAAVVLHITGDGLTVTAKGQEIAAETGEHIDCAYFGDPITVRVNPIYLADALHGLASKRAELSISHPHRPINVTSPDDPQLTYQHTVVPIRNLSA